MARLVRSLGAKVLESVREAGVAGRQEAAYLRASRSLRQ